MQRVALVSQRQLIFVSIRLNEQKLTFIFNFPFSVKNKHGDRYMDHLVAALQFSSVRDM